MSISSFKYFYSHTHPSKSVPHYLSHSFLQQSLNWPSCPHTSHDNLYQIKLTNAQLHIIDLLLKPFNGFLLACKTSLWLLTDIQYLPQLQLTSGAFVPICGFLNNYLLVKLDYFLFLKSVPRISVISEFILFSPACNYLFHLSKMGEWEREMNLSITWLILTNYMCSTRMLQIRVHVPRENTKPMHEEAEAAVTPSKFYLLIGVLSLSSAESSLSKVF